MQYVVCYSGGHSSALVVGVGVPPLGDQLAFGGVGAVREQGRPLGADHVPQPPQIVVDVVGTKKNRPEGRLD